MLGLCAVVMSAVAVPLAGPRCHGRPSATLAAAGPPSAPGRLAGRRRQRRGSTTSRSAGRPRAPAATAPAAAAGEARRPRAAARRLPRPLGLGTRPTVARCGPELSSPDGIEAQTCVLTQERDTWARTYYRNATGDGCAPY